jgi:hypothetical protein
MSIEINFDDLKGLAPAAGKLASGSAPVKSLGGLDQIGTGGDLMSSINGFLERVNTTILNAKEMIGLVRGMNQASGPGPGQPAGAPAKMYQPQPTLAQQLHRAVNVAYGAYGDVTITELLQTVLQQYGNTKLSAVLKALQGF